MSTDTSFRQKTITGVIWNFLQLISQYGIRAGTTFLLAWFLVPADFGLMAEIAVFFAIANSVMDSGFVQALIRKKEVSLLDYSTVFYTNLLLGVLAYLLLFASAPAIGSFFNEPRLVLLVRVAGLVVIINSFQLVQVADLTRKMDFKAQFRVTLPATLLSGIAAVTLAILGYGIWSMVAQMLISALAITVFYWIVNRWRPLLAFSKESFLELFGFGSKLFVSGLTDTVFNNLYVVVIGRLFSAIEAGYYFFGMQIETIVISLLLGVVQNVTYPALATLQDDNESLKQVYRKIILTVSYVVFPAMISLVVLAEPLFRLFLKDDWLPAVPYLQLICIIGLMYPLHSINLNILKVKGRSDLFLYVEFVKKGIEAGSLILSLPFGIFGILVGQIVGSVLAYIPNIYFSKKLIGYSIGEQARDVFPTLMVATATGVFMYLVDMALPFGGFLEIIVCGSLGLLVYMSANHLLKIQGQPLMLQIFREQWNRRSAGHD